MSTGFMAFLVLASPSWGNAVPADTVTSSASTVIEDYCVRCHNDRRLRGNLSLMGFDADRPWESPEVAEKVIHKLRAGMMPPRDEPRPDDATLTAFLDGLERSVDTWAAANPNPGWRTFQRLNRAEYERAIRDLLDLDVEASAFLPNETISDNFDNIADVQQLSVTLMEGYMRAAAHVSRMAVGDPDASVSETTYKVPKTASQMEHVPGAPMGTRGGVSVVHTFPADGEYRFKLDLHPGPTGFLYGMTMPGEVLEVSVNGERVAALEIDRWMSESDPLGMVIQTDPVFVKAGPQRISAAFIQQFEGPVDDLVTPVDFTLADAMIGGAYGVTTAPHLRDLVIGGPYVTTGVSDTPSRERVFSCYPASAPEERACAEEIVTRLASRAYRRPVRPDELEDLLGFYDEETAESGFEIGVRTALQALLTSPHFIFRIEQAPADAAAGDTYRLDDYDLASRLAFFLWASPPDDHLMEVARAQDLGDPAVLEAEARRMLADPRSGALATRFASQWLRLQDLEKIHPDAQLNPYWDHTLTEAMERETLMLFQHLVREDGSVFEILDADYTFVNERLARHYGIPGVTGREFRRVAVNNEQRRGILGHGSVLTLTSHPDRTSPVLRGKWVMEVLLGSPPPPPPPNVPDLDATDGVDSGRELTTRERMEQHRSNPACLSCHRVIDPIGLALDNFDGTGAWRIKENSALVDAAGELWDGTPITSPSDLRNAILRKPSVFARTFTRNLMAYALGRRVEAYDMPTVRAIERAAAEEGNRMSSFILGVVGSPAFRMSRVEAVADGEGMEGMQERE
ncbi:MAG: DUF1592 domain-containing protein [Gemmatimonadota bacterium]|nr:DUF1592 domain-containing protein [Gemmatimonadota bacterium]MDH5759451.1 DUF1592 domain-containing protein [Gemmatimonadota bacterium]